MASGDSSQWFRFSDPTRCDFVHFGLITPICECILPILMRPLETVNAPSFGPAASRIARWAAGGFHFSRFFSIVPSASPQSARPLFQFAIP
jgi:hypothetical protein